jgi:hypothetical protein
VTWTAASRKNDYKNTKNRTIRDHRDSSMPIEKFKMGFSGQALNRRIMSEHEVNFLMFITGLIFRSVFAGLVICYAIENGIGW